MEIFKQYDLIKLNTFGVPAYAKFFATVQDELELQDILNAPDFQNNEKLFLGGGSNVLFTKDFNGIVVLNKIKGIEIVDENEDFVFLKSMAGEGWHDLVSFTVSRNYWGIENLSLIPGTVGAAPMQNIGAYGAELKNVLENVEVYEIESGKKFILSKEECELGYRDSIFKNKSKGKYFIFAVTFKLHKKEVKNITYKVLKEYLEQNKIEVRSSKDISDAVSSIRRSKLPDPKLIGNAGSFFKNIFVEKSKIEELLKIHKDMPSFEEDGVVKIPAGWLIEKCGWKGKRVGNVGMHDKQALVLVNYGGATGQEIKDFSQKIIDSVYDKFGLILTPEVNLI